MDEISSSGPCQNSAVGNEDLNQTDDPIAAYRKHETIVENLRAQLEAAEKQKLEYMRHVEEYQHQQKLKEEAQKQHLISLRSERQKKFVDQIDEGIVIAIRGLAATDKGIQTAVQFIARNQAEQKQVDALLRVLANELIGNDQISLRPFATRVLGIKLEGSVFGYKDCQTTSFPQDLGSEEGDLSETAIQAQTKENVAHDSKQTPNIVPRIAQDEHPEDNDMSTSHENQHIDDHDEQSPMDTLSPQEIMDMFDNQVDTVDTDHEPCLSIKRQQNTDVSPTTPKRRKLTEIEKVEEAMRLAYNIHPASPARFDAAAASVETVFATPASTPKITKDFSSPVLRRQDSVASSQATSKHTHDRMSVDSRASGTPSQADANDGAQKQPKSSVAKKQLPPTTRIFVKRLENATGVGISVRSELDCQKCGNCPEEPRLTACVHLYCGKCVAKIRKAGLRENKIPTCDACHKDIGKRCTLVSKEQIDEWKQVFATDADGNGDGDGNDGDPHHDEMNDND